MIWTLFVMGLASSLHCVGMCLPMHIAIFSKSMDAKTYYLDQVLYHFGRITTYGLLGIMISMINLLVVLTTIQKWVLLLIGLILILGQLASWFKKENVIHFKVPKWFYSTFSRYTKYPVLLGALNGLIPCGLVYAALALSFLSQTLIQGFTCMVSFGIGTLPLLIVLPMIKNRLSLKSWFSTLQMEGTITLIVGIILVYRAYAIHIPEEANFWNSLSHPIMCH